jgi:hypothetical protein
MRPQKPLPRTYFLKFEMKFENGPKRLTRMSHLKNINHNIINQDKTKNLITEHLVNVNDDEKREPFVIEEE